MSIDIAILESNLAAVIKMLNDSAISLFSILREASFKEVYINMLIATWFTMVKNWKNLTFTNKGVLE